MGICFSEPTIDELLDDSLTQGLMRADGVDAAALKIMLVGLASSIESRPAVQHDRIASHDGVVARNELGSFQTGGPNNALASTTFPQTSNLCIAW